MPFTICVVSVLKIAFYDKKKSLTINFYLQKGVGKSVSYKDLCDSKTCLVGELQGSL